MPFLNKIRLPLYIKTPQFPTEANRFRLSDGTSKTLSVTIRKTWELQTDYMGELTHQRLVVALNHDTVTIEGDKYIGSISVDGDYEISWPDFLDYPLGQATVKVQVTPFDMTNSNCQTCEEASQLALEDNTFGSILEEGSMNEIEVFSNDSICCFPITAEIVWFASGYLDSATIDSATGIVTVTVKNPVNTVGSIKLATYRVTCPDGSYDEADIYGIGINGSGAECEQPSGFEAVVFSDPPAPFSADIEWTAPAVDPASGYEWELYEMQTPGTPVQTGTSADKTVTLTGLVPGTDYGFYVRSVCGVDVYSPYSELLFQTPASGVDCGTFIISCNDGTADPNLYNFSYMDCVGNIINTVIINLYSQTRCMLMDAFNNPVYFQGDAPVTYLYDSPC